jgi:hypothetical protein
MRISELEIKNFRGIRSGTVHFDKFTVLICTSPSIFEEKRIGTITKYLMVDRRTPVHGDGFSISI